MRNFEQTGERFYPHLSNPLEISVNMERYISALEFCEGKDVLELGCGAGLGTYLYQMVAKHVTAIDYSQDAIEHAKLYPTDPYKVNYLQMDLEKEIPQGKFDVTIALEFLEHINNVPEVLEKLDTKFLVFSVPMASLAVSNWHKWDIKEGEEGLKQVREVIEKFYHIEKINIQAGRWIYGYARKKKSWL